MLRRIGFWAYVAIIATLLSFSSLGCSVEDSSLVDEEPTIEEEAQKILDDGVPVCETGNWYDGVNDYPVDFGGLSRCSVGVFVTDLEHLGDSIGMDEEDLPNGCFPNEIFTHYSDGDVLLGRFYVSHFGDIVEGSSWIEYNPDGRSLVELSLDHSGTPDWILYYTYEGDTTTTIVDGTEDGVAKFESGMVDVFALAKAGGLDEDKDGLNNERLPLSENPDHWSCLSSLSLEVPTDTPWPPQPGDAPGIPRTSGCDLHIEIHPEGDATLVFLGEYGYYVDDSYVATEGIEAVFDDEGRVLEQRRLYYKDSQQRFVVDWAETFTYTADGRMASYSFDSNADGVGITYTYEYTGTEGSYHTVRTYESSFPAAPDAQPRLLTEVHYDGEHLFRVDGYRHRIAYDLCATESPEDPCLTGPFSDQVEWRYSATYDSGKKIAAEVYPTRDHVLAGKPHETITWEYDEDGHVIHTSYIEDKTVKPGIGGEMVFLDRVWLDTHGLFITFDDIHDIYYEYDAKGWLVRESRGGPPGTPGAVWLDFQYSGDCTAAHGAQFIHY